MAPQKRGLDLGPCRARIIINGQSSQGLDEAIGFSRNHADSLWTLWKGAGFSLFFGCTVGIDGYLVLVVFGLLGYFFLRDIIIFWFSLWLIGGLGGSFGFRLDPPYLDLPFVCKICAKNHHPKNHSQFWQKFYISGRSPYERDWEP